MVNVGGGLESGIHPHPNLPPSRGKGFTGGEKMGPRMREDKRGSDAGRAANIILMNFVLFIGLA